MHGSRVFLYLCFSFIAGIGADAWIGVPKFFLLAFSIFGLAVVSLFWKEKKRAALAGFCLLIFSLGAFRNQMFTQPKDVLEYYKNKPKSSPIKIFNGLRDRLGKSIDTALSPPQSSLLGAIMLGETDRLSKDFKQKLNRSGTRHITAISGMHVVILANLIIAAALMFGFWRGQAFYVALIGIIIFVIMAGAPASAIRAGIMGGIVLVAEKLGRFSQSWRLLTIAAAIMLAANPLLLKFDVGFELSFLATLGIAKLSPWFLEKLSFVPKFFAMRSTLSMTLPAILFTVPVLMSNFGQLSLASIISNILILPTLPFVLGLGFVGGIAGIFSSTLGHIAFWPVWLILTYVVKVIEWSAALPFAVLEVKTFPWYVAIGYFALLWWGMKYFKMEK